METKANYTLVGMFTVLVFAAAFAFVYWIAATDGGQETADLDVVIEGSVTGLGVGSPVLFNGINVGKVTSLRFDPTNPRIVIARARVRRDLPITSSTRAVLGSTGLTGIVQIEFEGGALSEKTVFQLAEEDGTVATVKADPSALNDLILTAQDIFERADNVLGQLEGFVTEARAPLTKTLENTSKITDAIARNSDKVEAFMSSMGDLGDTLEGVSGGLNKVLNSADGLIASIDPDDVKAIVADIKGFTDNLNVVAEDLSGVGEVISELAADLGETGPRITQTFDRVDELLAAIPADDLNKAVSGFSGAGEAVKKAAEDVASLTGTFADQQDDVEKIVTNAREMVERLNAASVRVDGVLAKVDGFLGDSSADSLMGEVSETLTSFRQVADTLNSRLDGITAGLERFSGRGLRDVESLVSETRRSIARIESAISSLESNPQRLLFGGDSDVKRFDGRERR
jgi:phospholipid/cholesterol/gamma-HCH transport system substrate-binding protein